jgi:hypothetical protein
MVGRSGRRLDDARRRSGLGAGTDDHRSMCPVPVEPRQDQRRVWVIALFVAGSIALAIALAYLYSLAPAG